MYYLKERKFKLVLISWGRDDDDPSYFSWLKRGFECTFKGKRLVVEF